jgi:hypothetical protein
MGMRSTKDLRERLRKAGAGSTLQGAEVLENEILDSKKPFFATGDDLNENLRHIESVENIVSDINSKGYGTGSLLLDPRQQQSPEQMIGEARPDNTVSPMSDILPASNTPTSLQDLAQSRDLILGLDPEQRQPAIFQGIVPPEYQVQALSENIDPQAPIVKTGRNPQSKDAIADAIADQEAIIGALELKKQKAMGELVKSDANLVDRLRQFRIRRMGGEGDSLSETIGLDSDSSSGRLYQVRDPNTGDIRYVTQAEALGNLAPLRRRTFGQESQLAEMRSNVRKKEYVDLRKGYQAKVNKATGRYEWVDRVTGARLGNVFSSDSNLNPVQKNMIVNVQGRFFKDTKESREAITKMNLFRKALDARQPMGDRFAEFTIARLAQGAGVLSDTDLANFQGETRSSIIHKVNGLMMRVATGTMSDTQRKFLRDLADIVENQNKEILNNKAIMFNNINKDIIGTDIKNFLLDSTSGGPLSKSEFQEFKELEKEFGATKFPKVKSSEVNR